MLFAHFPYRITFFCSLIIAAVLTGCCTSQSLTHHATVKSAEDAAHVYVSAYPAVPWTDISAKLVPNNNLTITDARSMSAQTTQVQVSQFLSTFAAGLGLGLQVKTENLTTAIGGANSGQTTGTTTQTSGTVPSSSGMPTISATNPTPSLSSGPMTSGIDGRTILTEGTALYQQAQILDNQISNEFLPDGYQAHLITLQVNLQPKQRDVSYDAYTDASFLPSTWEEAINASDSVNKNADGLPPIMIYPLVIMDAMETTNVGRTIEAIRQASLALSGVIGNVGANASVGGGTAAAYSIAGLDKNSLVTVGRISDHTVRIRFGAENSGSAGLALVPQTYNISLVVLTRWDLSDTSSRVKSLHVVTHTWLVSTENGEVLKSGPTRSRDALAKSVSDEVHNWNYSLVNDKCAAVTECPNDKAKPNDQESVQACMNKEANLNLLRAVDRRDYAFVKDCMNLNLGHTTPLDVQQYIKLQRFLAELIEIQFDSDYSEMQIALKQPDNPTLPYVDQLAIYSDDGKHTTTAVLLGGKGLNLKHLKAALQVQNPPAKPPSKDGKKDEEVAKVAKIPSDANLLLPTAIAMTGDGSEIDISFPSLAQAGLTPTDQNGKEGPLFFAINDKIICDDKTIKDVNIKTADGDTVWHYALRETKAASEPVKNPNPVTASSSVLVADSGVAQVTLQVGEFPDATKFPTPLQLNVKDAFVSGAFVHDDSTTTTSATAIVITTSKGVPLTANSVLTLELYDLTPGSQVVLTTTATKDKKPVPVGDPITFTVVGRIDHAMK